MNKKNFNNKYNKFTNFSKMKRFLCGRMGI